MEITSLPQWTCVDLISDIHLHANDPATFAVWRDYLASTPADALFILGDLFDVWVGDDVLQQKSTFEAQCVAELARAGQRLALYLMHGNRDFLIAQDMANASHAQLLDDPSVLTFAEERILLTHGDALCLADTEYQVFREMVRSAQWQSDFLAQPLAQRQHIAGAIRSQSQARRLSGTVYADVDSTAALKQLDAHRANLMLHGHTHLPAEHLLSNGKQRVVLSDWSMESTPVRAQALRLSTTGAKALHIERIALAPA